MSDMIVNHSRKTDLNDRAAHTACLSLSLADDRLLDASPDLLELFGLNSVPWQGQTFSSLFRLEVILEDNSNQSSQVLTPARLKPYLAQPVILHGPQAQFFQCQVRRLPLEANTSKGPELLLFEPLSDTTTGQTQPEATISTSEQTLKRFMQSAPFLMGVVQLIGDDDLVYVSANPATGKFFHGTEDSVVGKRPLELGSSPELLKHWLKIYAKAARCNGPASMTYQRPLAGGGSIWVKAVVAPISLEKRLFSFVSEDITAQKVAEERFQGIFNSMFTFMGLLTPDGILIEANRVALEFAGVSRDAIVNQPLWKGPWWRPEDITPLKEAVARAASGEFVRYEIEMRGTEQQLVTIDFSLRPIRDERGQISYLIPEARDITEFKRQETELRRSNEELRQFASVASHDLQEPLRKILAFSERLGARLQERLSPQETDYLQRMQSAAVRMQRLIDDLLSYSRLSTHGSPFEKVDLNLILAEVIETLELRIEETSALITADHLPELWGDPHQLRQLFQNLLGNSLKYTKPGRQPELRIQADSPRSHAFRLVFSDNGIGFENQQSERIFEIFHRLHGRSSDYAGSGIGLSLCRRIVERHGGVITASGKPDQGARFEILLPLHENHPA